MKQPLISVIVPCYGVERYLNRCMESIVNQTLKDIEIILVDDKSPDNVPQICNKWALKDKRIKVIHKERNEGLGLARNTGLEVATGKYVAFVDSDDYISYNMYEKLYNKAIETSSDIVYCGVKHEIKEKCFIDINDFSVETTFYKRDLHKLSIRYFDSAQEPKLIMSVWHSIYKRETIGQTRFYSERLVCSEDLPFQIEIIQKANKVTYIPDTLYYYCLNNNSLSKTFNFEKCFKYFSLAKIICKFYSDEEKIHIKKFFLVSCRNFIRHLISSSISYREKRNWILSLCDDNEIINFIYPLKKNKINKMKYEYVYLYCIINKLDFILYIFALIDLKVITNKLGIKNVFLKGHRSN